MLGSLQRKPHVFVVDDLAFKFCRLEGRLKRELPGYPA